MTQKQTFNDIENHPLWAMLTFIEYGLNCAAKDSRQPLRAGDPPDKSRQWLRYRVEGAVLCLRLVRDTIDEVIS